MLSKGYEDCVFMKKDAAKINAKIIPKNNRIRDTLPSPCSLNK